MLYFNRRALKSNCIIKLVDVQLIVLYMFAFFACGLTSYVANAANTYDGKSTTLKTSKVNIDNIESEYNKSSTVKGAVVPNGLGSDKSPAAEPDAVTDLGSLLTAGNVEGHLRLLEHQKFHNNYTKTPTIQHGLAIGGDFLYQTGAIYGFNGGLGINAQHVIKPLSPSGDDLYPDYGGKHLSSITQAYLQYHNYGIRIRAGRQLIDTPFASPAMYTSSPRAFYGITATFHPLSWLGIGRPQQLAIFYGRLTKYKSRFSDEFIRGNKYFHNRKIKGFTTVGVNYKSPQTYLGQDLKGRLWYYEFDGIAELYFSDGQTVMTNIGDTMHPLIGFQVAKENDKGKMLLGNINSQYYGLKLGIKYPNGSIALVGSYTPVHEHTYQNGGLVLPYARMVDNGGEFTLTMNNGNMLIGPGYGYGIRFKQNLLDDKLNLYFNYIRFLARYGYGGNAFYNKGVTSDGIYGFAEDSTPVKNQHQQAFGFGVRFNMGYFSKKLDNLFVQDQFSFETYRHAPRNFSENRFRIVYSFE